MKNSKEEANFVKEVSSIIKNLNVSNLTDSDKLKDVINIFALKTEHIWRKNSKHVNIMRYSESWWNKECSQSLGKYEMSRNLED